MIDNLLGGDDEEGPDEAADDMDGGLFEGDEGGDDLMDGGGDDLMDGGDMGDDLMGDDGMGFDEMDDEGAATSAEMDNRIDELENEVASLSSTVNTVKSENEQISESLEDVEENVRKLLEVYEMVTRGVNPFVDENEMGNAFDGGGGGGGGGGGSMELFGGDEEEEDEAEIDDSVADADADEFFDDDLDDGDDFEDFDDGGDDIDAGGDAFDGSEEDDFDDFDDGDDFEDSDDFEDFDDGDDFDDFDEDADDGGDDGGKSFEELKAEYDSGDADWDDEGAADGDENGGGIEDSDAAADAVEPLDEDGAVDGGDGIEDPPIGGADPAADETADAEAATEVEPEVEPEAEPGTEPETASEPKPVQGGKPYLETLPAGYVADIVVMDWLEFLVDEAGVDGAARTVAYYEAIDWLDEPAAETLQTFLDGFGGGAEPDPEPRSSLTVDHHNRSLRFISRIANPDMEMVAFDERERGSNRAQRSALGSDSARETRPPAGAAAESGPGMESDGGRQLSDSTAGEPSGFDADPATDPATESGFDWRDDRTE